MKTTQRVETVEIPPVLTPKLIYELGLFPSGVNQVYELWKRQDFPGLQHGKRLIVGREAFFNWVNRVGANG